ncbi:sensor histidine kinase [Veillonella agrestimuris]|uniref:sensor histidine kinase n=1 Tax=Veillonella agrestimuris TaxID=2941340 RepID=UPI002040CC61|nr:sensor histidine kinase [Veillonella agrestimuris]
MTNRIYEDILSYTELDGSQASLLIHIATFLNFGSSITGYDIEILTPVTTNESSPVNKLLCMTHNREGLSLIEKNSSSFAKVAREGEAIQVLHGETYEYAFPIVDNGGKIIGVISFSSIMKQNTFDEERDYILVDTVQRLMLTATEEQVKGYEPMSYLDGLIIFDQTGTILYGNEGAFHLANTIGVDRRLEGNSIFGSSLKISAIQHVLESRTPYQSEEVYYDMVLRQQMIPIPMGRNETRCILILHDWTRESKQQQELLVKNSIIKEIHHRVKNNLQTVAGLLRMEARRSDLPEVKSALQEGISRIESMALVHDLVSHYDEDYIAVRSIYDELCRLLRQSLIQNDQAVEFRYTGIEYIVSSHQASYISLIINELITNCLEHGLAGLDGTIWLDVQNRDEYIDLIVSDTGRGFPENFDIIKSKRLGMQIINNLVIHELGGHVRCNNTDIGAAVTISIKKEV